jgi:dihydroxyacid dehydratase/phosphogluconate dehydratase
MSAEIQIPIGSQPLSPLASNGFTKNDPANWTCYSAGESLTERVLEAAENHSTPNDILSMLAESCNIEVRMAVAGNKNTLLETVVMLSQDESADLRYQLAKNHNIPESVLHLLAEDPNPYVVDQAKRTLIRLGRSASIVIS